MSIISNDILIPIQVGKNKSQDPDRKKLSHILGDNTGENISGKSDIYKEKN